MTFIKRSSTDPSQAGFNKGAIDRVVTYLSTKDPDERRFRTRSIGVLLLIRERESVW